MKKSELKEMIRQAMLEEVQSIPPHLYINNPDGEMDSPKRMINRYLGNLGVDYVKNPLATNNKHYVEGVENIEVMMSDGRYEEADQYAGEIADKISMLPSLEESISEDKKDKKEEEEDIEIEDIEGIEDIEDTEIEDIPSSDVSGITGDEKEVQDSLESALIAAKKLGDEKLINQIGNSITFFTRSHVVGSGEENLEEVGPVSDYDAFQDEGHPLGLPDFKDELDRNVKVISKMLTPVDSALGVIQWLMDNPDDIPAEVDEDFFYANLDQIREKLLQIDLDNTIGEAYAKNRMLKIAGLK